MAIIFPVGLFCCDEFEETPKQKVINMSKLNKLYFNKTHYSPLCSAKQDPSPVVTLCFSSKLSPTFRLESAASNAIKVDTVI